MATRGRYRVLVVTPNGRGGIQRLFQQLRDHADSTLLEWDEFLSVSTDRNAILGTVKALWTFQKTLRTGAYDLVHINLASRGSTYRKLLYAELCARADIPYVLHLHGGKYRDFFRRSPLIVRRLISRLFKRASGIVVLGAIWADFVHETLAVEREKICIVPNGVFAPQVDRVRFKPHQHVRFLFSGRISEAKGIPELLEALSDRGLLRYGWRVTLAGDGDVAHYKAVARSLNIEHRVRFVGWANPESMHQLLTTSDVLLLPSRVENLPLSLLEGMGYGLMPIATDTGAVNEVVEDERNGFLIEPSMVDALRLALLRTLENHALIEELSREARNDFDLKYNIVDYPQKLTSAYNQFGLMYRLVR